MLFAGENFENKNCHEIINDENAFLENIFYVGKL